MKLNEHVTNRERTFSPDKTLVSTTDTRGIITYANKEFMEISGFSEDELLHHNHNVIRHPDMPSAVFKEMWDSIKKGYPWQGMIKNRCKNGDYYWVFAYVTPVYGQGGLVGYQSVRTHPTREQVAEAEANYKAMRESA